MTIQLPPALLAQARVVDAAPAGGAAIGEVIAVTAGATVATLALVALGLAHRSGRTRLLARIAAFAARRTGLASFAALPAMLAGASLLTALVGMMWDISLHIDEGRDAGPLANPAHYLILAGLFGVFAAGLLAIVLPAGRPSPAAVRISGDWYAPVGGIALLAASAFALLGFPLDDLWHRIFGQDVTLWSPTHLMLIGGAGMSLIGVSLLLIEGRRGAPSRRGVGAMGRAFAAMARGRRVYAAGGLLLGLSVFQAEFDFGVPQFALMLEPVMLAFAAGVALVVARIWLGPGAALGAALVFCADRAIVALIVGPGLGEATPHFPLYLAEALVVELAALAIGVRRRYAFGALTGALVGTAGFAGEYAWSHVWMPIPWPAELIGAAWLPTLAAGIAAGVIGAFVGAALRAASDREAPRAPSVIPAAVGVAVLALVVGLNIGDGERRGVTGEVRLSEVSPAPHRTAQATIRISDPELTEGAYWVTATAWQGGGFHLDHLERLAPGVYRTTEPIPVHGTWKAMIRIHSGDALLGLPIYLPADSAIPAPAVAAPRRFERDLIDETGILQRERRDDVPGALAALAYSAVGAVVLVLVLLLGWILVRVGRAPAELPPLDRPADEPVAPRGGPATRRREAVA